MKRRTRILLWVIAAIPLLPLAALLGLALLARLLYPWPDPVPGVRLEPLRPPLPDNQIRPDNAFYYLRQLTPIPQRPATEPYRDELIEFRNIGWETGRYPACVQCLVELGPNRKLFAQAAAVPNARAEAIHLDSTIAWRYASRNVAGLLAMDAERAAAGNRWDDAATSIGIVLRNTAHLTRCGYFSSDVWLGFSRATQSVRRLAIEKNPPAAWLREMLNCLEGADQHMGPWIEEVRHRRLLHLQCPDLVFSNLAGLPTAMRRGFEPWYFVGPDTPPPTPRNRRLAWALKVILPVFGSSPERSRRHLDVVFSHYLSILEGDNGEKAKADLDPYRLLHMPRQDSWAYWLWLLNDPVGRVIALKMEIPCMGPSLDDREDRWLESVAGLRAAELTCAIRLYQAEHEGKPPETLAALMPQYLARLPDDPFAPAGTPFGYRTNPDGRFVLWCRSMDRVDHGGRHDIRRVPPDDYEPVPPGDRSSQVSGGPRFRDKYWHQRDFVFASDDFPKLRALGIEQARERTEREARSKAEAASQKPMPGKWW